MVSEEARSQEALRLEVGNATHRHLRTNAETRGLVPCILCSIWKVVYRALVAKSIKVILGIC